MKALIRFFSLSLAAIAVAGTTALAKTPNDAMGTELWSEAMAARAVHADRVTNDRYMIVIDYRRHSSEKRFFLVDMETMTADGYLVSHGQGSDADHDGIADTFSNISGSKMSSLGTYVTAETYYGKHGLSLRLDGLDDANSLARDRAIVIHGADYVFPGGTKIGRSWGCPALEQAVAADLIPRIAEGTLIYTRGPELDGQLYAEIVNQAG
ncbi:murein L,D-transpeptidase catalytic domain family protein [Henriciella marina]|uniref:murein L,D-transpeptidase catalytic domain family protein n=1 Tax=Henriciella marina TaxID=453851 RepID=UPI0012EAC5B5|nr:murein L,D-transpeptidase catalytic domain family protein [Henriciella marina]